jgi:hypothetical protein
VIHDLAGFSVCDLFVSLTSGHIMSPEAVEPSSAKSVN